MSSVGLMMAPPHSTTSREAEKVTALPFRTARTPVARPFFIVTPVTCALRMIVRFARLPAGPRKARAALWRRPLRMFRS